MANLEALTKRQRQVYELIRSKIRQRGYGPTVREIGAHFKISSPNGVMCHLKALEKKGMIIREPNMSRAIQLSEELPENRGLPLAGRVAAGVLHEAVADNERVDFTRFFTTDNDDLFVLKVQGDSMIDAQIADGDYVVMKKQPTAHKGQIVVARTDENEATLKRWYPEANRIRLEPANKSMQPIYVKKAAIDGVLVGVVRTVK